MKKLGLGVLFVSIGLIFCACGGDKKESTLQERVQSKFKSQLLSFEEAKKEVGLKDSECLKFKTDKNNDNRFIKDANGEIKVILIGYFDDSDTIFVNLSPLSLDELKAQKPECFN